MQAAPFLTGPFKLGSLACPACGQLFPLHTEPFSQPATCAACGYFARPSNVNPEDALQFSPDCLLPPVSATEEEKTFVSAEEAARLNEQRQVEEALCGRCNKARKCYVYAQQTRGADEGQTINYECSVCHEKWALNS